MKLTYNMTIPTCIICGKELTYLDISANRSICYACKVAELKKAVYALKESVTTVATTILADRKARLLKK